jgi:hypothetical protein
MNIPRLTTARRNASVTEVLATISSSCAPTRPNCCSTTSAYVNVVTKVPIVRWLWVSCRKVRTARGDRSWVASWMMTATMVRTRAVSVAIAVPIRERMEWAVAGAPTKTGKGASSPRTK